MLRFYAVIFLCNASYCTCAGVSSRGAYAPDESNQGGNIPPVNMPPGVEHFFGRVTAPDENISVTFKNEICP